MVTLTTGQRQEIEQILQSEIECAQQLLNSLELEHQALTGNQTEILEEIVREKLAFIQQLEAVTRQREKLVTTINGFSIEMILPQTKPDPINGNDRLSVLWNKLVGVAELCQQKNRINGRIVESISRQSRNALDILQGVSPATVSVSELYDNSGHTKAFTNKRSLVHV